MKNPIFEELKKLKLISKSNLRVLSDKTRDKKIKSIIYRKSNKFEKNWHFNRSGRIITNY